MVLGAGCHRAWHPTMLILASQSPRRSEILRQAGIPFTVRPVEVDETPLPGEDPRAYVERLALAKALAAPAGPQETVLAADTTVTVDGALLAKPADAPDARRMLSLLSGRRHDVLTGICLRKGETLIRDCASTAVWFQPLSVAEIDEYVASGEPADKAGAYAIQGLASKFVSRIEGCYFNVMGLPVSLVYRHLANLSEPRP
jgi:septum formation protein